MKGAIKNWLAGVLLVVSAVQAQGLANCPGTSSPPSLDPKARTWACMHTWNPCKMLVEDDSNWPTWPLTSDETVGKLKSPMVTGGGSVVPGSADAYEANMCQVYWDGGVEKRRLKPEWKLYHRSLFNYDKVTKAGDADFDLSLKVSLGTEKPYFSLYNTHTGMLRTFVFVMHPENKQRIYSQSFLQEANPEDPGFPNKFASALGVLENGMGAALPLSLLGKADFPGWTESTPLTEYGYFWYVSDRAMPYNIWDEHPNPSQVADRYLTMGFFAELESEISIEGEMITVENSSEQLPSGLSTGRYSGISGKLANVGLNYLSSGGGQSLSFDLGSNWTNWNCEDGDCDGFSNLTGAYNGFQTKLQSLTGLPTQEWAAQGINLGLGPVPVPWSRDSLAWAEQAIPG